MNDEGKAEDQVSQQTDPQVDQSEPDFAPGPSPIEAPPPPPPPPAAPIASAGVDALAQTEKTASERKALLANTLQGQVASGARIESQGDFQAVVVRGHRTNHLLHFLIGVFTLGLWWIVWFFIAVFGGEKRQMINVDQFGNVFVQKV